ncbi:hypothetical protein BCR37DRAFT_379610 [Protomyces lactucae-debilis]|uniref:REJ domain-containing protein n=1 Tax=Protomyces lactucae-debilis TaxID=2754530 RepID=A0A1Y2FFB4_PROLT|nr:uncharacterized protein BCR37DRAFT_379610 [Protomyces lactucae-debilis]ORY82601.1 hypothetical protein BCR37DRAFT_379610 [Protomyces lactucae-debilis]
MRVSLPFALNLLGATFAQSASSSGSSASGDRSSGSSIASSRSSGISGSSLSRSASASSFADSSSRGLSSVSQSVGPGAFPVPTSSSSIASSSAIKSTSTSTSIILIAVTPDGTDAASTAAVVQQVVVIIDGLSQTTQTSLFTRRTTVTPELSTITETEDSATSTPAPTFAQPTNGGVLSTSSVVVVIDGQGNIVVGPDGQTMTRERRTSTRQIVVTVFPSSTAAAGAAGGPQLVTGNLGTARYGSISGILCLLGLLPLAVVVF